MQRNYEIKTTSGPRFVTAEAITDHIAIREDKTRGLWAVDHIPSGLLIVGVKDKQSALNVATSIADAWHWVDPNLDMLKPPKALAAYLREASYKTRVQPFGETAPKPPKKKFRIDIEGSYTLSAGQLWPDGDWPENPTTEDVLALINQEGGANCIIAEWNLDVDATVTDLDALKAKLKRRRP